ncbi:hypothetical protein Pmar_PMAR004452 [Perkinsus marinus ATCC 50983]|uniref:Uncharacterized protein n=1 Tax=Perkinsus marinus (strain ATCC 50983 / TXsc) TaxID=423536 RepID=C5LZP7_PERM5|nr:hypothetical protein Pmar_PMAR004452 [Perkinsus marinus ATCC 50983]EEQ97715.1 hypothetical protein Pmar_PMAR004452 [Perkinsus marinus ATCC 50983]|eukprot:XP_002764998.1 hypothetical protein Pmar_PMAR004452 [Perkinsus marinus ATCC 50983]
MSVVEKTATVEEKTKEEKDEKSMSLGDLLDEVLGINGAEDLLKFIRRIVGALVVLCLIYLWYLPTFELAFNLVLGFIVLLIGLVAVASWTVSEAQRIEAEQKKAKELAEQKDEAETSKDTRSNTDETKKER